jgi:hypothetical protein
MSDNFFDDHDSMPLAAAAPAAGGFFDEHDSVPVTPIKPEPLDGTDAAISGVANALTFNMAPKIIAGVRAGVGKLQGEGDLGPLYQKYLAEQNDYDEGATKASPKVHMAAEFAGGLLNPVNKFLPGGSLMKNVATGIGVGALGSAAKSKHDLSSFDEAKELGKDTLRGAEYGLAGGALGTVAGAAISAAPRLVKKGASVLLGAPEDAVDRLVANPEAVNAAPEVPEQVRKVKDLLAQLKDRVTTGSADSRQLLNGEDTQHSGKDIANFFQQKIDDIVTRSEGALSPSDAATVKYLEAQKAPFIGENAEKVFSGNRVKNLVQDLQRKANYQMGPGEFSTPDDAVIKGVAKAANSSLKGKSPEYAAAMEEQARKTDLLNQLQNTFKTDQGLAGLLNRVRRDRAPFAEDLFTRMDKEFGTDTVNELRNALAREAFEKGATNGSRNVNLYRQIFADWANKNHIPFGGAIGAGTGAVVDKYGPGIARSGIDAYNAVSKNPVVQDHLRGIVESGQGMGLTPSLTPAITDYLLDKQGLKKRGQ